MSSIIPPDQNPLITAPSQEERQIKLELPTDFGELEPVTLKVKDLVKKLLFKKGNLETSPRSKQADSHH